MSWAVFGLCKNPAAQRRLREECNAVGTECPSFDELNSLPFLDAVVRETLRLYAPVPGVPRVANEDTFLPLSTPFVDVKGITHSSIL